DTEILALGGPALKAVADHFLADLVSQSVMGFWEPLKKIPWFWRVHKEILLPALRDFQPGVVVPVDSFGFNRFTAQAAHRAGRKVYYFISPQVWASRPWRINILRKNVDKMLTIFPFEEKLYKKHDIHTAFVGHPLLDVL
ncbi:MAG TPA: lipid-A-disaccharide synthase, partial [Elusimicrobiota bacterium]|nr:lipid-A-disaccharide synthase [Elusimicrobiota bacterium]